MEQNPLFTGPYPKSPPEGTLGLSLRFMEHYRLVPVEASQGVLKVVISDMSDPFPLEALRLFTEMEVAPLIGREDEIIEAARACYGSEVTMDNLLKGMDGKDAPAEGGEHDELEQLKGLAQEAPIVNLVNLLLSTAIEERASDIHIEPYEEKLNVRYRIDGVMSLAESLPKRLHAAVTSRIKIMARLNIAERRLPQDGRIKIRPDGRDVDIRVSTVPTLYGESIVMRLLDPSGMISLEAIGFSGGILRSLEEVMRQPHGMVLVTGPTGSGKTTTLYAALSRLDTDVKKVITIEDPIEYKIEGINQIQVKPGIGLTFGNGLKSIVRQDPDVIMVGEIRDLETADIAVHSALTGHLLLSTLHTNDAPGAVTRLQEMGVESYLISSSLLAVLAQRLVRVICPHCKAPDESAHGLSAELERIAAGMKRKAQAFKGLGCEACGRTGYRGRTVIAELMTVNEEIRELIVEKKGANLLRARAADCGMTPMRDDGLRKVIEGITTIEEVSRVTLEAFS